MKFFVVSAVFVCAVVQSLGDDSVQDEFDVKPGGQEMVYKKKWNNYECIFTYAAQGGTNEKWQVRMEITDNGQFLLCSVERGGTSYLYFESFSLKLSGTGVSLQAHDVVDTGEKRLEDSEYQVDKEHNTLSHVPGKFKNHLERVTVQASLGKTEL